MKKITRNSLSTTLSVSFDYMSTNGSSTVIRRIIRPFLMIWLGCFLLSILTAKVFAQGQYTIIGLPAPNGGGGAYALNESGDVVGRFRVGAYCCLADHAFLYHAGVMTDLDSSLSTGPQSSAYGVNRRLQVVGSFHESPGFRPFLWQSGAMSDILPSHSIDAIAYGINDAGLVVGNFIGIWNPRGFIYDNNDGTTTLIGTSSSFTNVRAVNSNGDIVGYFGPLSGPLHAFLMPRGASLIDLGTVGFFAGERSSAYAVNNRRDVVGTSDTPSGRRHAFLYSTGRMRDIDTLGSPNSVALGINDNGTIVGYYSGSRDHAFRYTDSDGMVPLDTLLPFASSWSLTEARAINSAGQIVGWGITLEPLPRF